MNKYYIIAYIAWNICVFFIYGTDKMKAKKGAWRIPENTLLLCAFFFGAIGAYIGMKNFRHKTKHTRFRVLVPLFVVLNLAFIAALQAAPQRIEEVLLKITSAF